MTILQVRYLVGIEPYDKSCAGCDIAVIAENTMDITFDTVRFVFVERQPCQNLVLKRGRRKRLTASEQKIEARSMVCCRTVGVASLSAARRVGGPSSTLGRTSGATWVDWFQHLVLSQWCSRTLDFTVTDRTRRASSRPSTTTARVVGPSRPPSWLGV